jgi:hypothetical protein
MTMDMEQVARVIVHAGRMLQRFQILLIKLDLIGADEGDLE